MKEKWVDPCIKCDGPGRFDCDGEVFGEGDRCPIADAAEITSLRSLLSRVREWVDNAALVESEEREIRGILEEGGGTYEACLGPLFGDTCERSAEDMLGDIDVVCDAMNSAAPSGAVDEEEGR